MAATCLGNPGQFITALAELSTRQIAESDDATGMAQNKAAAKTGGQLAQRARLELEGRTGMKVVSPQNFLPPAKQQKAVNDAVRSCAKAKKKTK